MGVTPLGELREFLAPREPGALTGCVGLEAVLAAAWPELDGADAEAMRSDKLYGRVENPQWEPPRLTFVVERHGQTVNGSSRASLHTWTVDVAAGTATCRVGRFRQLRPRSSPFDVGPVVAELVAAIAAEAADPRLRWLGTEVVRVQIGQIVPDSGPAQTVQGRRRRLREALTAALAARGWSAAEGPNTYWRQDLAASVTPVASSL
jgi:hypothetical protein